MGLGDGFLGRYSLNSHGPLDIGLDATKGTPLAPGRVFFATDSNKLYYDEGDSWLTIGNSSGTASTWSQVLTNGAVSSGVSPQISAGDQLKFLGTNQLSVSSVSAEPASEKFYFSNGVFSSNGGVQQDSVWTLGYNITAATGARVTTSEPGIGLTFESYFCQDGTVATNQVETYWQYITTGGTQYRPFSWLANRTSNIITTGVSADVHNFTNRAASETFIGITDNNAASTTAGATVSFGSNTGLQFQSNNIDIIKQLNHAGNAQVSLIKLDDTDVVRVDPSGKGVTFTGFANGTPYFDANANAILRYSNVAIANNATQGYTYIPAGAGTPTGVPSYSLLGANAIRYDVTAHKLWIYDGGWKSVTFA